MPDPERILVVGAGGMISTALVRRLGVRALAAPRAACDIRDHAFVARLVAKAAPFAIFNCAAVTNVDQCEREPALAEAVNRDAVANLARLCRARAIPLVHYSTDYVFDGSGETPWRETDARNPINVYGRTKAESETAIETIGPEHLILRVQWVFGDGRPNFVADTARRLRAGEEVRAFDDQWGAPCFADDIARMTLDLFERGERGLFHLVNQGYATRVMVAEEIARVLGIASPRITAVKTRDVKLAAARPLNSRMSTDRLEATGVRPLTWQDDVGSWLRSHQAPFR